MQFCRGKPRLFFIFTKKCYGVKNKMKKVLIFMVMFICAISFSYASLNDNVIAHYNFNEVGNNSAPALDYVGINHLTAVGNLNTQTGVLGSSRGNFTNANYFLNSVMSILPRYNTNHSVSFWYYHNVTEDVQNFYLWGGSTAGSFKTGAYYVNSVGVQYIVNYNFKVGNVGNVFATPYNFTNGETYFITISWNYQPPDIVGLYTSVSNSSGHTDWFVDSQVLEGVSVAGDNDLWVGRNNGGGSVTPQIYMDELTIWNDTLKYVDIITLFNNGNGLTFPYVEPSTAVICSVTNCLFKDDFYTNTSANGYTGSTNITDVQNNTLFFNSYVFNQNTLITHPFISNDTYNKIEYYITFDLNYNTPPLSLNYSVNQNSHTFSTWLNCADGSYPFNLNFDVFSWNTYSGNYDYTTFYGYNIFSSGYTPIGLFDTKNGGLMVFRVVIDKTLNKMYIYNTPFTNPLDINVYTFDEQTPIKVIDIPACSVYNSVSLMRRDVDYVNTTYDVGIKQIIVKGDTETSIVVNPFIYTNATTNANATIKTDIAENLQNTAFNFGFKTTASKLLLWFIILLVITGFIMFSQINNTAKSFLAVTFGIGGFILGWYLGFIPTALLVFIIFAFAIIGALLFKNLMSGGN